MKIQAAVIREQSGSFDLTELDLAEPKDDEVLVKIVGVGICHTDLNQYLIVFRFSQIQFG